MVNSAERWDKRDGGGSYWLSRSNVDRWVKEMLEEMLSDVCVFCKGTCDTNQCTGAGNLRGQ